MHSKPQRAALGTRTASATRALWTVAPSLALCLFFAGCAGTLPKHTDALALATAPVVDEAAAAYANAEKLNEIKVNIQAVEDFGPSYNPRTIQPLLSDQDIQARLSLLEALQCYVRTLVQITHNQDSPALDAASVSVGNSLAGIGNTLAPAFASAFSLPAPAATTTSASATATAIAAGPITPAVQNGLSTAVQALGLYLVNKKIKSDLPPIIQKMDPTVEAICELLVKDLALIENQEKRDYDSLLDEQRDFITKSDANAKPPVAHPLDPEQRREQIMKLPEIVRQQRRTEAQLKELHAAIVKLELTHHALAADAQGNNPGSFAQKFGDLSAAGSNLGKFYSSLPTATQ